jgi:hypothetical protein
MCHRNFISNSSDDRPIDAFVMCTPLQVLTMITRPLFTFPACQSQDIVAVVTPAGATVSLWFDARCRTCGLSEVELISDVDEEPPIVARWPTAAARVLTAIEWTCLRCEARQLALGDRSPSCAFCGDEIQPPSRGRQWN